MTVNVEAAEQQALATAEVRVVLLGPWGVKSTVCVCRARAHFAGPGVLLCERCILSRAAGLEYAVQVQEQSGDVAGEGVQPVRAPCCGKASGSCAQCLNRTCGRWRGGVHCTARVRVRVKIMGLLIIRAD
jgi:hypothetical protein